MSLVFNVSTAKCIYVYHLKEAVSKVSHPCRLHFMKLTAHIFEIYILMTHAQYLIVYAQFSVIHFLYFMVIHALYFINTYHLKFTSTLLITSLLLK